MKALNTNHIVTLLSALIVLLMAEPYYPTIFIHGMEGAQDGHAKPDSAWMEWDGAKTYLLGFMKVL
ncbi:MAG: hypothetical protein ACUVQ4_08465 [bacterium]